MTESWTEAQIRVAFRGALFYSAPDTGGRLVFGYADPHVYLDTDPYLGKAEDALITALAAQPAAPNVLLTEDDPCDDGCCRNSPCDFALAAGEPQPADTLTCRTCGRQTVSATGICAVCREVAAGQDTPEDPELIRCHATVGGHPSGVPMRCMASEGHAAPHHWATPEETTP